MRRSLKGLFGVAVVGCLFLVAFYAPPILTSATDEEVFSAEKLEAAQRNVERYVDEGKLAGVLTLVAHRGEVIHQRAYGVRNLDTQVPMDFDTIFRLASMTKPLSSVALMMLYEEGKVSLDDPIATYIPAFAETKVYGEAGYEPLSRPITVKDALMHTTGITTNAVFGKEPAAQRYREANLGGPETLEAFVDHLATLPLAHQPGVAWTYGYSTDDVARIVEVVSGEPFEAFMTERIPEPLGMHDTGFVIPEAHLERVATAYTALRGDSLQVVLPPTTQTVDYARGVSGLHGTAPDYLRFAQMMLNNGELDSVRFLQPETVDLMTQNHLPASSMPISVMEGLSMINNGFGLGFSVVVDDKEGAPLDSGFWWNQRGRPAVGSYWWIGALQTYFWIDPANKIIGMVMTQSSDLMPFAYKQVFHTMVYEAYEAGSKP